MMRKEYSFVIAGLLAFATAADASFSMCVPDDPVCIPGTALFDPAVECIELECVEPEPFVFVVAGPGQGPNRRRSKMRKVAAGQPTPGGGEHHVTVFKDPNDGTRHDQLSEFQEDGTLVAAGHGIPGEMEEVDTDYFIDVVGNKVEAAAETDDKYEVVVLHVCHAGEDGKDKECIGAQVFDELVDRLEGDAPPVIAPVGPHGSSVNAEGRPVLLVVDGNLIPLAPEDAYRVFDHENPQGRPAKPEEVLELYGDDAIFTPPPRGGYGDPPKPPEQEP